MFYSILSLFFFFYLDLLQIKNIFVQKKRIHTILLMKIVHG